MSTDTVVIRNAKIVDGTGGAPIIGDVAIANGRIAEVGKIASGAAREIDARGHVLSPGFIDIHTHYDPQLCWDRLATPSLEHGVTTVVVGNCSLSLAPVRADASRKLIRMFGKIEDIKEPTFDESVPIHTTRKSCDDRAPNARRLVTGTSPSMTASSASSNCGSRLARATPVSGR